MELIEAIQKRKSVRKFQARELPDLSKVLLLAQRGPTAGGLRGFKIILRTDKIAAYNAPAYAVICVDVESYARKYGDRGRNLYSIQDAAIVGAYLQLLLVDMGLASVWIGAFDEDKIREAVHTHLRPVAIIAMGYEDAVS